MKQVVSSVSFVQNSKQVWSKAATEKYSKSCSQITKVCLFIDISCSWLINRKSTLDIIQHTLHILTSAYNEPIDFSHKFS